MGTAWQGQTASRLAVFCPRCFARTPPSADVEADAETNDENLLQSDRKIKVSTQKKLDKIPLNGKKSKAIANVQRDMKKNNQIYDIMNTQIDNFKFDDI